MDEALGQVSSELTLGDVEFLGRQTRGTTGGAGTFEPARSGDVVTLLRARHPRSPSASRVGLGFPRFR